MSNKETTARTLTVALVVCLVCSVFVAGAAVALRPLQHENALLDKQRNILAIAGMGEGLPRAEVLRIFEERFEARLVDLDTGKYSDAFDADTFNNLNAAKDNTLSRALTSEEDIASIKRREKYGVVYVVEENGQLDTLLIPVRGYGLWSTLHGFIAIKGDLNTVAGLGFYEHAETPGMGGEVDNPRWKAGWVGKKIYNAKGEYALNIVKGGANPASPRIENEVDGLAGATLTSKGVDRLIEYWLGDSGFGLFLTHLRNGEA